MVIATTLKPGSAVRTEGQTCKVLEVDAKAGAAQREQIREGIRRLSIAVAHELEHRSVGVMV